MCVVNIVHIFRAILLHTQVYFQLSSQLVVLGNKLVCVVSVLYFGVLINLLSIQKQYGFLHSSMADNDIEVCFYIYVRLILNVMQSERNKLNLCVAEEQAYKAIGPSRLVQR